MFRRNGYWFADKNLRQIKDVRAYSDAVGTEYALAAIGRQARQRTSDGALRVAQTMNRPFAQHLRLLHDVLVRGAFRDRGVASDAVLKEPAFRSS